MSPAEAESTRKSLHALIDEAESLAQEIRLRSAGHLSLAVVNSHGITLRRGVGTGWHAAHEAADQALTHEAAKQARKAKRKP